ncbi:MAG TPA: hypothetical protein ENI63_00170 [Candidatus Kaiserbacteria bacterium]|nr:hypothetical protein [Candidatus Kaiserbacteria bacterium]
MYRNPLFISWVLILVLIAVLHIIALEFFLYWIYSWFDILMHFLGGLFVVLSALWFFFQSGYVRINQNIRNIIIVSVSSIVLIGVSWEIFEVIAGVPIEDNYILDTITDLIMDVVGTIVATFAFVKIYAVVGQGVKNKGDDKYDNE